MPTQPSIAAVNLFNVTTRQPTKALSNGQSLSQPTYPYTLELKINDPDSQLGFSQFVFDSVTYNALGNPAYITQLPAAFAGLTPGSHSLSLLLYEAGAPTPVVSQTLHFTVLSPVPPPTPVPPPAPIPVGASYTVEAGETLHVQSTVLKDGLPVARIWQWGSQVKPGMNAAFYMSPSQLPGDYTLFEYDAWTLDNEVQHKVTVLPDPYKSLKVASGSDLDQAIAAAPNLTRLILPANSQYTPVRTVTNTKRLQIVSDGTATITIPFAGYFLQAVSGLSQLTVVGVKFTGPVPPVLNPTTHKTGITAFYVPQGSFTAVNCTAEYLDQFVQLDSRPTTQCDGVLIENLNATVGMCGVPVWLAGKNIDITGGELGPSAEEHPLRASTVNPQTNQIPSFIRVGGTKLTAVKQSTLAKECLALRDCENVVVDGCTGNTWAEVGQGSPNPWDAAGNIIFNNFTLTYDTLHVRMGTTGPVTVQNSKFQLAPVVGVKPGVVVNLVNNKP